MVDTYFAPAEKSKETELTTEIEIISTSPLMTGMLHSVSGLLAVLNENRQVISLNDSFMKMLGINDSKKTLGLRIGEVLQCVHAKEPPAGCGTTKFCSTCGAAIATVTSLSKDLPVERTCALSTEKGAKEIDIALLVRAQPIKINQKSFLLLFLQDITQQEQRAALERTFFHDINNMLGMLVSASEMLVEDQPSQLSKTIHQASIRLTKEVSIQRYLSQNEYSDFHPIWFKVNTKQILDELQSFFENHPAARGKKINILKNFPSISFKTDISLLLRVLCNMTINALEATINKGVVKIWAEYENKLITFYVWNAQEIPQDIVFRIFQRNFSTKGEAGRGIGTYSMKLLGEKILGGQVSFTTSKIEGTTFKYAYPILHDS